MRNRNTLYFTLLAIFTVVLTAISLYYGSVDIPASVVTDILSGGETEKASWTYIVLQSRVPQTITAILTGAALAVSGLMLQTVFNNPLADSSILGISSGSSLGAALVILGMGGSITVSTVSLGGFLSVIAGAMTGAFAIMAFILFLSTLIKNNVMLLIAGIMTGYV
uniref:iron chelate uptake ABC transporter family permease subunit n=1 Tax=uncultured Bacteroides sp. TaxID=162156 RepID=UPI00262379CA